MITSVLGSGLSLAAWGFSDVITLLLHPLELLLAIFYTLSLLINWLIYELAATMYSLFPVMYEFNFSSLTETITQIINRLEAFVGVFMLFVVAFNLLQYMIDPDKKEGATTKLVTKVIVSLVLLVSSSFIFGILDDLQITLTSRGQDRIVDVLLYGKATEEDMDGITQGRRIVYAVFFNMYQNQTVDKDGSQIEYNAVVNGQDSFFKIVGGNLWSGPLVSASVWYHFPFLAEVFGLFLIMFFATFTIDVGVRNITLLFLRILFPVAAIGYVTPKGDQLLSKYVSTYISTYVQLFIKIFVMNFMVYIFLWVMNELYSGELMGIVSQAGDATEGGGVAKVIFLLLILLALFAFFTKGLPAIMEKVFGIKMDSSILGTFGKALGIAAAGASLLAGGAISGIAAKASGASGAGVAKAMLKGAQGGASAGWNMGKQVGSGNLLGAVQSYGRGVSGTVKGVKGSIDSKSDKFDNIAKEDEKNYEASKEQLDQQKAILNELEKKKGNSAEDKAAYDKQKAMVDKLQEKTDKLKEHATKSSEKAHKIDPNYQSNAEKKAIEAEKDYNDKLAAVDAAVDNAADVKERFGENSNEYKRAEADVDSAKKAAEAAHRRAEASAEEATKWNKDYKSTILIAKNDTQNNDAGNQTVTGPTNGTGQPGSVQVDAAPAVDTRQDAGQAGVQQVVTPVDSVVQNANQNTGTVAPTAVVAGENSVAQPVNQGDTQASNRAQQNSTTPQGTVVQQEESSPQENGRSAATPNTNNTGAEAGERQNASEYTGAKEKADNKLHVENAEHVRNGVGTSTKNSNNTESQENIESSNASYGNAAAEEKAFQNIREGRPLTEGINKNGTVEGAPVNNAGTVPHVVSENRNATSSTNSSKTSTETVVQDKNSEPAIVIGNPAAEARAFENIREGRPLTDGINKDGTVEGSGYVGRKDADINATNAENERLINENIRRVRASFGVNMDEETEESDAEDSDSSEVLEIKTPAEEENVDPVDAELETIMQNDMRAYGERASRRFRELADEQRMDAVVAMQQANNEAHDAIKSIAKDLINGGMSVRAAYEEARRLYNEGK